MADSDRVPFFLCWLFMFETNTGTTRSSNQQSLDGRADGNG
jgi:hypothetical protein